MHEEDTTVPALLIAEGTNEHWKKYVGGVVVSTMLFVAVLLVVLYRNAVPTYEEPVVPVRPNVTASSTPSPLKVVLSVHLDPVGLGTPYQAHPTREERIAEYKKHRQAFLWLKAMAAREGVKISAQMTGPYAEFVTKLGDQEDFRDSMPGEVNHLGTHLHGHYKAASDTADFVWSELKPGRSPMAPTVFKDNITAVNGVFEKLHVDSANNNLMHGYMVECDSMSMCLGITPNPQYTNRFIYTGGVSGYYHPYRQSAELGQMDRRSLQQGALIGIPSSSPLIFGQTGEHKPDGYVYGDIEFAQRDFIMEYLEWVYSRNWDTTGRPFVSGFVIHPHNILPGVTDTKGREVSSMLESYFVWLNTMFGTEITYENYAEVFADYVTWEHQNPTETILVDSNPATVAVEPRMFNKRMVDLLGREQYNMHFTKLTKTADLHVFEFANAEGNQAIIAVSMKPTVFRPTDYLRGASLRSMEMGQELAAFNSDSVLLKSNTPVLFIANEQQ